MNWRVKQYHQRGLAHLFTQDIPIGPGNRTIIKTTPWFSITLWVLGRRYLTFNVTTAPQ
jgi:hypothetical protein